MLSSKLKRAVGYTGVGFSALVLLSSCATFGGNVSGSFQCRAGEGICAPTTMIDDQALALIAGETVDGSVTPAGPFEGSSRSRTINAAQAGAREIRIVFPAYVDRMGRTFEATAVRAYVRSDAFDSAALARGVNPKAAPSLTMSGPGLDDIAARAPQRSAVSVEAPKQPASTSGEVAAQTASTAVDEIKDQVATKLASKTETVGAGSFPAGVE